MLDTRVTTDQNRETTMRDNAPNEAAQSSSSTGLEPVLCKLATCDDEVLRVAAVKSLGMLGGAQAVDTLRQALLDEDLDVRSDAAEALARIADDSTAPQLLENLLGDPCREVKLAAIDALTAMRRPEVVLWLRSIVRERDADIAWDEEGYYKDGWDDWLDVQLKALTALGEFGGELGPGEGIEDTVDDIVAAIADVDNQDLTEAGFPALARMGKPGTDALATYLETGDTRLRRRAAVALARSGEALAGDALAIAVADPEAEVRSAAIEALIAAEPESLLPDLLVEGALADPDPGIRALAARWCLSRDPEMAAPIVADPAEVVRIAGLEALRELLDQPGENLKHIPDLIGPLLDDQAQPAVAALAAEICGRLGEPETRDRLTGILADPELPEVMRLGALRGLSGDESQDVVVTIARVIGDDARQLRLESLAALAALSNQSPWPNLAGAALIDALDGLLVQAPAEDEEEEASEAASEETETNGEADGDSEESDADAAPAPALSTLDAILGAGSAEAKVAKERSQSGNLTPAALEYLAISRKRAMRKRVLSPNAKASPHLDVRLIAARVLGDVPQPEVAESLLATTEEKVPELRRTAADSLARLIEIAGTGDDALGADGEYAEHLLNLMRDSDRLVRLAAIRAMGHSGEERYQKPMATLLSNEDAFIRREALTALGRLGASSSKIAARCRDPEPGVRLAAIGAVVAVKGDAALDALVTFGLADAGYHIREAAELLKRFDLTEINARLLTVLNDEACKPEWLAAIALIGAMNSPAQTEMAEVAVV